jgi:hypothetical protein
MRRTAASVETAIREYERDKKEVIKVVNDHLRPAIYGYLRSISLAWSVFSLKALSDKLQIDSDRFEESVEKMARFEEHLFYFGRLYGTKKTKELERNAKALSDSLVERSTEEARSNSNAVASSLADIRKSIVGGDVREIYYEAYVSKKMEVLEALIRVVREKNRRFDEKNAPLSASPSSRGVLKVARSDEIETKKEAIEVYDNLLSIATQCLFHKMQKTGSFFASTKSAEALAWLMCQSPDVTFKQFPNIGTGDSTPSNSSGSYAPLRRSAETDRPEVARNYALLKRRNKEVALNPKKFGGEERAASTTDLVDRAMRSESIKMANFGFYAPTYDGDRSSKRSAASKLREFLIEAFPPKKKKGIFGHRDVSSRVEVSSRIAESFARDEDEAWASLSDFSYTTSWHTDRDDVGEELGEDADEFKERTSARPSLASRSIESIFVDTGSSASEDFAGL